MSLHLHACHHADHARADVRVLARVREETTERLREETEKVRPLLRWPMRSPTNPQEDQYVKETQANRA